MKRVLKITLIAFVSVFALAVAATAVLALTIDPNDYRDDIERLVERRTGRDLTLAGPLELSVYPWLGAETAQATLGNAAGFGPEPFARVQTADLRVRLWPLLRGKITLGKVVLHGAQVNLARDANGRTNWADLTGAGGPGEGADGSQGPPEADTEPAQGPGTTPDGALAGLTLAGVELRDAQASWRDATTDSHYRATGIDLTSGAVRPGEPFPVSVALRLASDRPQLAGTLELNGRATVDPAQDRYTFRDARWETDLTGPVFPEGSLTATLTGDFAADLAAGTASIDGLNLRAWGSRVQSSLGLEGIQDAATVTGRAKITVSDGEQLAPLLREAGAALDGQADSLTGSYLKGHITGNLGPDGLSLTDLEGSLLGLAISGRANLELPEPGPAVSSELSARVTDGRRLVSPLSGQLPADLRPTALNGARLDLKAQWDQGTGTAELGRLNLKAVGADLRASASARGLNAEPKASGRLTLEPFSPRRALRALGLAVPETADPEALGEAALETNFAADREGALLTDLTATLDDSRLTGSAGMPAFAGPRVRFNLALNGLDADRYLPPPAEGNAATPTTPGQAAGTGASQMPLALLRDLGVNGELTIGRLRLRGMRLSNLRARVEGSDGRFRIHPLKAQLYEGRYSGDAHLDARGDTLEATLDERLTGIEVGALLSDLTGKAPVTGTADLAADLGFQGLSTQAILDTLAGQGSYTLRQGTIAGFDLEQALTRAYAALGKADADDRANGTRFRELKGSATVDGGKVRSDDLSLHSGVLDAEGQGFLDLAGGRVDYRLEAVVGDDTAAAIQELRGLTVPMRVQGQITDPGVQVGLEQALQNRAQGALEKEKEKAGSKLEKEKNKLKEKAKDLLDF
ncbi:AsmA family protein [Thiohalorhabdus sp.]|uniref:AsmA family protein n=1 Tax=Thiohalorhabdus sp. TaxID=3094134 RepID=UPI002FC2C924